jgi:hypothetical protein
MKSCKDKWNERENKIKLEERKLGGREERRNNEEQLGERIRKTTKV